MADADVAGAIAAPKGTHPAAAAEPKATAANAPGSPAADSAHVVSDGDKDVNMTSDRDDKDSDAGIGSDHEDNAADDLQRQRRENMQGLKALIDGIGIRASSIIKRGPTTMTTPGRRAAMRKKLGPRAHKDDDDDHGGSDSDSGDDSDAYEPEREPPRRSTRKRGAALMSDASDDDDENDSASGRKQSSKKQKRNGKQRRAAGTNPRLLPYHPLKQNFFGAVPNVPVGALFRFRQDAGYAGVHRPTVAGIHGSAKEGCYSIAVNGGYPEDVDTGDTITFTGSGGRDLRGKPGKEKNLRTAPQTFDMPFNDTNASLVKSKETGKPIRVIRGYKSGFEFAPQNCYRYDGLYQCTDWTREPGSSGYLVYRFTLERLKGQTPFAELPRSMDSEKWTELEAEIRALNAVPAAESGSDDEDGDGGNAAGEGETSTSGAAESAPTQPAHRRKRAATASPSSSSSAHATAAASDTPATPPRRFTRSTARTIVEVIAMVPVPVPESRSARRRTIDSSGSRGQTHASCGESDGNGKPDSGAYEIHTLIRPGGCKPRGIRLAQILAPALMPVLVRFVPCFLMSLFCYA
ncbi:hypothetical protein AMAG_01480 [Allomyces macrogynus ATCC 38327]|uniref:YDG domain-containing protein n=1 Tax=Allomyces macrogynus (strain ATCC 38327) TaxID=578462 RepID=A0A0L0RZV2_ALLM3|nr:hypothetical protein AMAG_01480 [Allomyces macrogynus ATCC 38327]|eukprot:KNE55589.1 hypothetical protein AMAG_01480 [Allomyces macrogynus ATCC 38327]